MKIARKFDKLISKEWPTIDSLCWFYLHCIYLSKDMNCWLLQISPNCVQYMIFILAYILRCLVNNSWKQEWRSSEWRRRKKVTNPKKSIIIFIIFNFSRPFKFCTRLTIEKFYKHKKKQTAENNYFQLFQVILNGGKIQKVFSCYQCSNLSIHKLKMVDLANKNHDPPP